jgi:hypothetical protein
MPDCIMSSHDGIAQYMLDIVERFMADRKWSPSGTNPTVQSLPELTKDIIAFADDHSFATNSINSKTIAVALIEHGYVVKKPSNRWHVTVYNRVTPVQKDPVDAAKSCATDDNSDTKVVDSALIPNRTETHKTFQPKVL